MQSPEFDFAFDFPTPRQCVYLKHLSCNGLLFSNSFSSRMADVNECYISNPLTKECVRLPNPTISCHDSLCGLAFENNPRIVNSSRNTIAFFKIVLAHSIKKDIKKASYQFEIYSSDKRAWQLLKWASKPHNLRWCKPEKNGVYCNRVLYWHCPSTRQALMVNMETETSGYLDLPRSDEYALFCKLTQCAGQLHYIQSCFYGRRLRVLKMSKNGE
ncbi:hypothetical protein MRB53_027595 [Persea americana]|uniref:Uncharacterized protein n=1 Tax=Persea americana TaxID=3435 RepID=A0ACC2LMK0_PERAE|nr:hypothetical protein MRB53_027595 [Persea americana]